MTQKRSKTRVPAERSGGLKRAPIEKLLKPHEVRYALLVLAALLFLAAIVALVSMWIILRAHLHG